ncbi:MAG: SusC/RagA family TonB-linked outer membrane protein [Gemmatimonadetes bacterium]|nr:SusC/RagA family TonB-linked outer membrane protein [Gemmatimonadota bacterium]
MRKRLERSLVALALATLAALPVAAQQNGTVTGRVVDGASKQPLVGARVSIVGTALTAPTNADGRYRITSVPIGTQTVRVYQIGYAAGSRPAEVTAGGTTTVDVELTLTPYSLDEFVVTATGEESKRTIGNSVAAFDAAPLVQTTAVTNLADVISAKIPGVAVFGNNLTGGGQRIRIRGNSSLSLSNNPIYVVDGVRIWSDVNSSSIGIGGTNPSRINDLNPEDIEAVEVVRGPSAATLYGTDAANGVIVIKTKRGKAGKTQWSVYGEQGFVRDYNDYPVAYRAWTTGTTAATTSSVSNSTQCLLDRFAGGLCRQDSVSSYNLFADPQASPNGTGYRNQYGMQVSGGTDNIRYYVSGEWENEVGVLQMPTEFQNRLRSQRGITDLLGEQVRPNGLRKVNLRANVNTNFGDKADLAISAGVVSSNQRLPQTDNNTTGLLSNAYGGPGFKNNVVSPAAGVTRTNFGYRLYTPDEFFSETVRQDINRTITSATANYRPLSWLAAKATMGFDFAAREDSDICRRDECTYFGTSKLGFKTNNRTSNYVYTGDANAAATYSLGETIGLKSIVGLQYIKEKFTRNGASGSQLPPGATTVTAGAIISADESTVESITLGFFAEQSVSYKDRVYLTGAVRSDRNSAFGNNFRRVYYPKASLSYVISDEPFFPKSSTISSLRLRGAFGASGRQPGNTDAIPFLIPTTTNFDLTDTPSLVFSALGNAALKPERSEEIEAGFDLGLFDNAINLEVTGYHKKSKDALIATIVAPSVGAAATRFDNLGGVRNKGIEAALNMQLLNQRSIGWDATISMSYNDNKVTSLGGTPPQIGTVTSVKEGFPVNGYFLRPVKYNDANGDGILAIGEITVGDTAEYVGAPNHPLEISLFTGLDIFGRKLRIQGLVDVKAGGYQLNGTERIRCDNRLNCRGAVDPAAPLDEQARALAVRVHPSRTQWGYVENNSFLRFRELSATYTLPGSVSQLFRAERMTLTASARNIGVITGYSGIDPEGGYFGSNSGFVSDFQTQPPPTYFTFKLNVAF